MCECVCGCVWLAVWLCVDVVPRAHNRWVAVCPADSIRGPAISPRQRIFVCTPRWPRPRSQMGGVNRRLYFAVGFATSTIPPPALHVGHPCRRVLRRAGHVCAAGDVDVESLSSATSCSAAHVSEPVWYGVGGGVWVVQPALPQLSRCRHIATTTPWMTQGGVGDHSLRRQPQLNGSVR